MKSATVTGDFGMKYIIKMITLCVQLKNCTYLEINFIHIYFNIIQRPSFLNFR